MNRVRRSWQTSSVISLLRLSSGARVPLLLSAVILALTAIVHWLLPAAVLPSQESAAGAGIAILSTIIGFLAIATLGISISSDVVASAVSRYQEKYIRLVFDDPEREALTGMITLAFVVSLGSLVLLVLGVRPWLSLVAPVLVGITTFVAMLGYVRARLELFSSRGIAEEVLKRHARRAQAKNGLWGNDPIDDIMGLCRSDIDASRSLDAAATLEIASRVLGNSDPSHRLGAQIAALVEYAAADREHNRHFLQAFLILAETFIVQQTDDPWCASQLALAAKKAGMQLSQSARASLQRQAETAEENLAKSLRQSLS